MYYDDVFPGLICDDSLPRVDLLVGPEVRFRGANHKAGVRRGRSVDDLVVCRTGFDLERPDLLGSAH